MIKERRFYLRKNGMYLQKYRSPSLSSGTLEWLKAKSLYKFDSPDLGDTTIYCLDVWKAAAFRDRLNEIAFGAEIVCVEEIVTLSLCRKTKERKWVRHFKKLNIFLDNIIY